MNQSSNRRLLYGIMGIATLFLVCVCAFFLCALLLLATDRASIGGTLPSARPLSQTIRAEATPVAAPTIVVQPIVIPEGADIETEILIAIYKKVNPSVVNVTVSGALNLGLDHPPITPPPDDLFPQGQGSGFVWDTQGHIVTNNHVVEGAQRITVTFYDGVAVPAEVVGTDVDSDLAVIKVDPTGLTLVPVELGRVEDLIVGQRAIAIGNPFGYVGSMTAGIISALGRAIETGGTNFLIPDVIQTDAAINPGNSGGPLLNAQGQVIGVNTQIRSSVRANSGVGFAVPVSIVARVVPALITRGVYEHAYIGISGGTFTPAWAEALGLNPTLRGAYVNEVIRGQPAARAGLRGGTRETGLLLGSGNPLLAGGDLIIGVDEWPVRSFDDILVYLERYKSPGDVIQVHILRNGKEMTIPLTLGSRPRQ